MDSSNSSKNERVDNGNTSNQPKGKKKQISCSKHWSFTVNNFTDNDVNMLLGSDSSIVPKYIFESEIGENKTVHLQGSLSFAKKNRPLSVFKDSSKWHWEITRNLKASNLYCQKDYVKGKSNKIWSRGYKIPYRVEIEKLFKWQKKVLKIIDKEPDDRTINWIWEEKGCAGKSTFAKYIYQRYDDVVVLSGKGSDMKNGIVKWMENKHGNTPNIVLIDVPRSNIEFLSWCGIEEIKNMFFYSGKYEGGMVCGKPPHVLIFANTEPDYNKISIDRWKVLAI